jgi:hypothetical protein
LSQNVKTRSPTATHYLRSPEVPAAEANSGAAAVAASLVTASLVAWPRRVDSEKKRTVVRAGSRVRTLCCKSVEPTSRFLESQKSFHKLEQIGTNWNQDLSRKSKELP